MKQQRKFSKLAAIICLAAFVLGMFTEGDFSNHADATELWWWALAGFLFFLTASVLGALLERIVLGLGTGLRRVADHNAPPVTSSGHRRWNFFGFGGLFFIALGVGMAVSAVWRDSILLWQGMAFTSAGLGLRIGRRIGLRILNASACNHD